MGSRSDQRPGSAKEEIPSSPHPLIPLSGQAALATARKLLLNHHTVVLLLFLLLSWGARMGCGTDLSSASYAGSMNEDAGQFIWHFQHLERAITGQGELLFSDRVFYPVGLQMVRQDWAPVAGLIALPFQGLGPLGAVNVQVLLLFVLCGYTTYLLALRLSRDRVLAFMAGVIFAFCEFRMDKSMGHINQANQQFIPLYMLFLLLYFRHGLWRYALGAAVSFFLATFCTYYQLVFVLVLTFLFLAFVWARPLAPAWRSPRRWPALARPVALRPVGFGLLAAAAAAPLFGPVVLNSWEGFVQAAKSLTFYMPEYSADLLSYVMSNLYTLPDERIFSGEGGTAYLGYTPLLLFVVTVVALRWRTGAGLWVFLAVCLFLISLGSTLVVAGKPVCELPFFKLLQALPVIKGAKVAARFSSLVVLCVAVGGAITLAHLDRTVLSRWSPKSRALLKAGIVALVCAEMLIPPFRYFSDSLPVPYQVPTPYHAVAKLDQDMAVLQYPLTWDAFTGNIGPHRFPRQLFAYQTFHGKPIFSGIGNMVPAATLRYLLRLPLVGDLVLLGNGDQLPPLDSKKRRAAARYVASVLNLKVMVVYKRMIIPGGDTRAERYEAAVAHLKLTLGATRIYEDDDLLLYAVYTPAPSALRGGWPIEFSKPGSLVHLGGGWRRTKKKQGWLAETTLEINEPKELYFRLSRREAVRLTLTQRCSLAPCKVSLTLNNERLGAVTVGARWAGQTITLPAALTRKGINRLRVDAGNTLGRETIPVGRTGVRAAARLQVSSAGVNVGDRASVMLSGIDVAPNTRGYNVAVIDPGTGDLVAAVAFDLIRPPGGGEAARMVRFLGGIPEGFLVCVAVRDDGSMGITPGVADALRSLGAQKTPKLRHSYALIGVKGAKPGTAVEKLSRDPVVLELGRVLQLKSMQIEHVVGE